MIFLIRRNGRLTVEQDMHTVGLFSTDTWLEQLRGAGFVVHRHSLSLEHGSQQGQYPVFCCVKA